MMTFAKPSVFVGLTAALWLLGAQTAPALADKYERQILVDRSGYVVERFANNPLMGWFRSNVRKAQAVLIVPRLKKGGFIIGGSGGSGVLLARDTNSGQWSPPAFYTMGSVTFGLQAGGEISEIILLIMTKRGLDSLLSDTAKLGGDVSVAAGPVGLGAKAATADVIAFSRTRGFYGGINVEGAVILTRDSWNRGYYGQRVSPSDILIRSAVRNPRAENLRTVVARVGGTNAQIVPATSRPAQNSNLQRDTVPPPARRDDGVAAESLPWRKP